MIRSVLLALCIPSLSLGFVRDTISQQQQQQQQRSCSTPNHGRGRPTAAQIRTRTQRRKQTQAPLLRAEISSHDLEIVLSEELLPQQETELWLDLRRTAIHPKSAIEQLEDQLGATSFVDRILLSEKVFQNLVDFKDMYLTTSQILYQSSETNELFLSSSQGLSTPFGSLTMAPSDATMPVDDPMQAIELISSGKWLMLGKQEENTEAHVESMRIDAVGKFLDIATTSCQVGLWGSSPETGGLVLPKTDGSGSGNEQTVDDASSLVGGVAVSCDTTSALMQLASNLQMRSSGAGSSVTESGIILQSSEDTSSAVATAVVLPFAIDLWQVATMVFGNEQYEEEDDDFE